MTPKEALGILDNIAAQASMNRREHEVVAEAVFTLHKFIDEKTEKEEESPSLSLLDKENAV